MENGRVSLRELAEENYCWPYDCPACIHAKLRRAPSYATGDEGTGVTGDMRRPFSALQDLLKNLTGKHSWQFKKAERPVQARHAIAPTPPRAPAVSIARRAVRLIHAIGFPVTVSIAAASATDQGGHCSGRKRRISPDT